MQYNTHSILGDSYDFSWFRWQLLKSEVLDLGSVWVLPLSVCCLFPLDIKLFLWRWSIPVSSEY